VSTNELLSRRTVLKAAGASSLLGTFLSEASATGATATESDWPQFQYDAQNTGYNPNAAGPTGELTERWSFSTLGEVVSSPVVVDDTVYVGSKDGKVYALDAQTGEKEWEYETGADIRSDPVVAGTTLYIGNDAGEVFALSLDGVEEWTASFDGPIFTPLNVAGGRLYVPFGDSSLVALNASSGAEGWRNDGRPRDVAVAGGSVFATGSVNYLYKLNASDGSRVWSDYRDDPSPPTYDTKTVYVGGEDRIAAYNATDGTIRWLTEFTDPLYGPQCQSIGVRDRTAYVAVALEDDSAGYALAFDTVTGERQWRVELPNPINSAPVLAGDLIYVGCDDGNVYGLRQSDGSEVSSYETGAAVQSTAAISAGAIFVGSDDGYVYALEDVPPNEEPTASFSHPPSPVLAGRESTFDATGSSDPDGTLESYEWDFDGNGATDARGETVTQTFEEGGERSVTLTVTDDRGASASTSQTVSVNAPPEPAYTYSPTVPDPNESVTFEAAASNDPDGSIEEYAWDFDDDGETEATGQQVTSAFSGGGDYLVTLTVTDDDGTTATTSQTVSVNEPPRASFSTSPDPPAVGQTVTFDASASTDPDGSIDRYEWDFDGSGSSDANGEKATREYTSTGEFPVALTVVGSNGATDTTEATISVVAAPETDTASPTLTSAPSPGQSDQDGPATTETTDTDSSTATGTDTPEDGGPADGSDGGDTGNGGGLDTGIMGAAAGGVALLSGGALWLRSRSGDDGDAAGSAVALDPENSQNGGGQATAGGSEDDRDFPSASGTLDASFGDFERLELLGSGGSGDVHKASITIDGDERFVALKTPRVHNYQTIDAGFATEFLEEAETWNTIDDHEHIVDVLDWGHKPQPWIAMEYMDGNSLKEHLPLDLGNGIAVLTAVADATQHAHRHGIAHGDLKPENILFSSATGGPRVKVGDWGLAQVLLDHSDSTQGLTPAYAAPEQFEGTSRDAEGHQLTDVYQLGAVAYAAFTGQPPFEGTPAEVMNDVLNEMPTPPSQINDSLPPAVDSLVLKSMSKEPDDRYPTAQHFRDALDEALDSL